ncbi:MAG: putative capsid protein [Circular genetic element sp.]|nr:MAG: putative capsid protein [Circular genetic element sp.]
MSRRRSKKLDPSVMSLWFQIGDNTLEDDKVTYIDLAQCKSVVNRRFYRQGMNYAIAGFRIGYAGSRTTPIDIAIETLPTTWPVGASWHKFFAAWQHQQNEALEAIGEGGIESKAKWNDFKIFFDSGHKVLGNTTPVTPGGFLTDAGAGRGQYPWTLGEWDYSQIVTPETDGDAHEWNLCMLGDDFDAQAVKAMIKHYSLSRNYPQSPDPLTPELQGSVLSLMTMVPPAAQSNVVDNAHDTNDELPYNQINYPGMITTTGMSGQLHREITMIPTATSQYTNVAGCLAPCGLLKISHNAASGESAGNLVLQVMLVPGPYKGYMAEPMQEMN